MHCWLQHVGGVGRGRAFWGGGGCGEERMLCRRCLAPETLERVMAGHLHPLSLSV